MLTKAMEVSGIEGSYRSTCERTMTVLRDSRDSLVAMLEAFVYDPLISWRWVGGVSNVDDESRIANSADQNNTASTRPHPALDEEDPIGKNGIVVDMVGSRSTFLNEPIQEEREGDGEEGEADGAVLPESVHDLRSVPVQRNRDLALSASRARSLQMYSNIQTWAANLNTDSRIASIAGDERAEQVAASGSIARSRMNRSLRQRELMSQKESNGQLHDGALNEKALKVVRRVQDKLAGTDFPDRDENGDPLDVVDQVQRLIVQATSVENLCQLFIGWCAFW